MLPKVRFKEDLALWVLAFFGIFGEYLVILIKVSKTQKAYALSLIIPVYNEEDYLGDCLDAVAAQTLKPLEVIVVDNNSTDGTLDIAKAYDFVTIVKDLRQHQSYAQHMGFSIAKGDIIGRIDADTIIPEDWVQKTLDNFNKNPEAIAITGSGTAYDIVLKSFGRFIHRKYFMLANKFAGHSLMWGSNCAFRRSAWKDIKDNLILRPDIWEDYDLAFCLAEQGTIRTVDDNDVFISYRSAHKPPLQQLRYHVRSVRTFSLRRSRLITAGFAVVWSSILLLGPIVMLDYYILRPIRKVALVKVLMSRLGYLFDA